MDRTELEIEIDLLGDILVNLNNVIVNLLGSDIDGTVDIAAGEVTTAWLKIYNLHKEKIKALGSSND